MKRKRREVKGWLLVAINIMSAIAKNTKEEGWAGRREERSQYLIASALSGWLKFLFMNTGEYIIVYTSVSLTDASRLFTLPPAPSLIWCDAFDSSLLSAFILLRLFLVLHFFFFPGTPRLRRLRRRYLFSDSISAMTASVSLLIQIRQHLLEPLMCSPPHLHSSHWPEPSFIFSPWTSPEILMRPAVQCAFATANVQVWHD